MTAYRPNCRRIPELNGLRVLLVFIVTSLTSMRQIQPIREMVQATRAYAADWPLLAGLSAARWIYAG